MYAEIVKEVENRPEKPHFVFLTGDMAFSGTVSEYRSLEEGFINPLKEALPGCPFFTVPGNHDLERDRMVNPRLWISDAKAAETFQSIDASGKGKRREMLLPRFANYAAFDQRTAAWNRDWLQSGDGSVWWSVEIDGAKVGVVGVNTAWLCHDDKDRGKLTPGRYMLEQAIDIALVEKPDLLIVLGHHPLGALAVEGTVGDCPRIIERLKQANAIYLHGHFHESEDQTIGDASRSVLTVQAPSAFQAHDDKKWRNGLMWVGVDLSTSSLFIEPRRWNEDKREYKFDIDAGYEIDRVTGQDRFRRPLPGRSSPIVAPDDVSTPPARRSIELPQGWEIVDRAALAEIRAQPPSADMMVKFFDGILPTWRLALARGVQARKVSELLATRMRAAHIDASKPSVVLLAGAGGEGKSTAQLHAAAALVEDQDQNWTCLHRRAAAAALPEDLFAKLPIIPGNAWVVVIDDADNVGQAIVAAVKKLAVRTDVHLLLAARDAEWQINPGMWHDVADFRREPLAGLSGEDARRIVAGWHAWGSQAMGNLSNQNEDEAAAALVSHAHDLAARKEEGALLGALLLTRQGEDIHAHVRTMVNGLGRNPVVGKFFLRDIYAMAAAMHAENQLYLSRGVLAYALGCDTRELERDGLDVVRSEAMLDAGNTYVLTRHRIIAEAACKVMREDGYDVDGLYPFLARKAVMCFRAKGWVPELAGWRFRLAEHFVELGEGFWPLARNVAKAVCDADPGDIQSLTTLSSVLRRSGQPAAAMAELKKAGGHFLDDRPLLYEWGTVAGAVGDQGLSVWLDARSLADGGPLELRQCKISLAGLGVGFRELFASTQNRVFATAQAACGQLGLRLQELDATASSYFEKYVADGCRNGVAELTPEKAIDALRRAVIQGAEEVEPDNAPVFFENLLGEPTGYGYTTLLKLVSAPAQKDVKSDRSRNMRNRRS